MALARAFIACLLLFLLTLHLADSRIVLDETSLSTAGRSLLQKTALDCGGACHVRCSNSWKPKMCKRACGSCCARCNCVPPGISVTTRAKCPCYATMTTHGGRLKCP